MIYLTCAIVAQCFLRFVACTLSGNFNPHSLLVSSRLLAALTTSKPDIIITFIKQTTAYCEIINIHGALFMDFMGRANHKFNIHMNGPTLFKKKCSIN